MGTFLEQKTLLPSRNLQDAGEKMKYQKGERLFVLSDWEGCFSSSFLCDKTKVEESIVYYYDPHPDWKDPFYKDTFDGWWPEYCIGDYSELVSCVREIEKAGEGLGPRLIAVLEKFKEGDNENLLDSI